MSQQSVRALTAGSPGALARPDWRADVEFSAGDLRLEQRYRQQRLRRHLRLVHGWGIVCGLTVVSACEDWYVFICPGYGIGPCGDEVYLPERYRLNLRDYLWTRPMGRDTGSRMWIAIETAGRAESVQPAPVCSCGCGCSGAHAGVNHADQGVQIVVSWTAPNLYSGRFDVCSGATPPCPPCPEICGLTLASVTLPELTIEDALFRG